MALDEAVEGRERRDRLQRVGDGRGRGAGMGWDVELDWMRGETWQAGQNEPEMRQMAPGTVDANT